MAIPLLCPVEDPAAASVDAKAWDAVVLVTPSLEVSELKAVQDVIREVREIDARVGKDVLLIPAKGLAGNRLIIAPTGPINRDYDDVRRYGDAARAGVVRAKEASAKRILLLLPRVPLDSDFERALEVALLGALAGLWEPLEAREHVGEAQVEPVTHLGFQVPTGADGARVAELVAALEGGRRLARDIAGTEPERMAPMRMAELCEAAFAGLPVTVEVVRDSDVLRRHYPLISAVARASDRIERHRPCVIRLVYDPGDSVRETILLAGKGVTYDTGGADLKTGGHMAGMSRDKAGAGTVAGFVYAVAKLAPPRLRVVAEIGAVRNSIGADALVSDEIVTSHAGVRVRIGNTDAEGRLVLADLLSHLRERAVASPSPRIMSVATLTGHAALAFGAYTVIADNGPAQRHRVAGGISAVGEMWGDPFEVSRVRREDYHFVRARSRADDVLSCNNAPSSATERGHQFPAAFLAIASGLGRHGLDSKAPLCFSHIDIAGSAAEEGDFQHGRPTAAAVVALAARWAMGF